MRVIIVEDEPAAANRLKKLILKQKGEFQILATLPSLKKARLWFEENPMPDLIFLDIRLEDGDSFSLFDQVQISAPIIFCTAYHEHALQAFSVNSIDYLLKPIIEQKLQRALEKYQNLCGYRIATKSWVNLKKDNTNQYQQQFLITSCNNIIPVAVKEIVFFQSYLKACKIHNSQGKSWLIDKSLAKIESCLDPKLFFRVSRQAIIRLSAIEKIHKKSDGVAVIIIGQFNPIKVSRANVNELKARLKSRLEACL